ncbi:MAG: Asp-tRNA(Asn)/Glu-tRNA(Gln) amidotransferase subunit GatC [Kiritimatiellia bacterium]
MGEAEQKREQLAQIDVQYVARLARIKLSQDELRAFQTQLEQIVAYVRKLQELNLEGVEPTTHVVPLCNVFRRDEPAPGLDSTDILRNAPEQGSGQILVPKIVE